MDMLTLKIKDRKYGMRKMPPIKGAAFGLRVANVVSNVLSADGSLSVLESLQKRFSKENGVGEGKDLEIDNSQAMTLGQVLLKILSKIDPVVLDGIFKEAFSWEVYYENQRLSDDPVFEDHFSQYPGDLYVVAVWATYNHVKDFFTGLGDGLKAFMGNSESKVGKG